MTAAPVRFGEYELLDLLGRGAFGEVFLARPVAEHRGVPTPVVIKRLLPELSGEARFVQRFSHEAQLATTVDSPYVAKVYDAGCVGDALYIAFEYIAGWSLDRVIQDLRASGGQATMESIGDLADDGLRGLAALHEARDRRGDELRIVHRDIAPKNMILGDDGTLRLIDLGIGKSRLSDYKTRTGAIIGSPGYMAPEQVLARDIDHRADLFSFAIVLFEMLTLQPYVARGSVHQMLRHALDPPFRPPSQARRGVPPELDALLQRALAKNPADRFSSAEEMRRAIRGVIPERRERSNVATLLGEMRWSELSKVRTEIHQRVLIAAPTVEDPQTPPARTVVFAMRPGVALSQDVVLDPTFIPDPTLPRTQPPRTVQMAQPGRAASVARALAFALGGAALLGAGMLIERFSSQGAPPPAAPVTPSAAPIPSAAPAVQPRTTEEQHAAPEPRRPQPRPDRPRRPAKVDETASPAAAEPEAPAPEVSIETRPRRPAKVEAPAAAEPVPEVSIETRPRRPAKVEAPAAAEPVAPAPEVSIETRIDRMLTRTRAVRDRAEPTTPARAAADRLLAELLRLRSAARIDAADPRITQLGTELERLERAAPQR